MKTPITDAAETKRMDPDVAVVYGTVPAHVAHRLELDRAALMDMISKIIDYRDDDYVPNSIFEQAERTLIKVRANFPES